MNEVFPALIKMLGFVKVSMYGRDNAMELIIKFVTRKEGCGWPIKFIDGDGEFDVVSLEAKGSNWLLF